MARDRVGPYEGMDEIRRMEKLHSLLDRFMDNSPLDRQWLKVSPVNIYVRKTPIRIGHNTWNGFTIASISVHPMDQRRGHFRNIVDWAKSRSDIEMICVESVITPEMKRIMEKWDWIPNNQDPPSYFWRNEK